MELKEIPIEQIFADKDQPRKEFDTKDLVVSIIKHGLLEPLKVIKKDVKRYKIVDGERRHQALVKVINSTEEFDRKVKCFVLKNINLPILQLVTDIHKQKLNPMEEANAMKLLIEKDKLSVKGLSVLLGKKREYVMRKLKILALSPNTQKKIRNGKISSSVVSQIDFDIARDKEEVIVNRIQEEGANVQRAKEIVYEEQNRFQARSKRFVSSIDTFIWSIETFFRVVKDSGDFKQVNIKLERLSDKITELQKEIKRYE